MKPYAQKTFTVGRITLPPLLWIWWDQVTASPLILAEMYLNGNLTQSVKDSQSALAVLQKEREAWNRVADSTELSHNIAFSLEDEYRIFGILKLFKTYVHNYFAFGDGGNTDGIRKEIDAYADFLAKAGDNFRFDFSEISPLLRVRQSADFKNVCSAVLSVTIAAFVWAFFRRRAVLLQYITARRLLLWYMAVLCVLFIVSSVITPYDFFWYFMRLGMIVNLSVGLYFYFYRRIAMFFGVAPRKKLLQEIATQTLLSLIPLAVATEIILLVGFWHGNGIFWRISVTLAFMGPVWAATVILGGAAMFFGLSAIWVMRYFPSAETHGKKRKTYRILRLNAGLALFAYLLFASGTGTALLLKANEGLYPSYFTTAGSGLDSA